MEDHLLLDPLPNLKAEPKVAEQLAKALTVDQLNWPRTITTR
ncbi:MAG: hypothetical protein ACR2MN_09310 [Acidimicrobiales bacterium]